MEYEPQKSHSKLSKRGREQNRLISLKSSMSLELPQEGQLPHGSHPQKWTVLKVKLELDFRSSRKSFFLFVFFFSKCTQGQKNSS